jgi:hypothetical protein
MCLSKSQGETHMDSEIQYLQIWQERQGIPIDSQQSFTRQLGQVWASVIFGRATRYAHEVQKDRTL